MRQAKRITLCGSEGHGGNVFEAWDFQRSRRRLGNPLERKFS